MRAILPVESMQAVGYESPEYTPRSGAKIIPFPGVTLQNQPGDMQDEIDNFLREMRYIE